MTDWRPVLDDETARARQNDDDLYSSRDQPTLHSRIVCRALLALMQHTSTLDCAIITHQNTSQFTCLPNLASNRWRCGSMVRMLVFGWQTYPDLRVIYG